MHLFNICRDIWAVPGRKDKPKSIFIFVKDNWHIASVFLIVVHPLKLWNLMKKSASACHSRQIWWLGVNLKLFLEFSQSFTKNKITIEQKFICVSLSLSGLYWLFIVPVPNWIQLQGRKKLCKRVTAEGSLSWCWIPGYQAFEPACLQLMWPFFPLKKRCFSLQVTRELYGGLFFVREYNQLRKQKLSK